MECRCNTILVALVEKLQGPEAETLRRFSYPAETWVTFTYTFQAEPTDAFVVVRDAMGKNVAQLQMPNKQGQLILDTRQLANGAYAVAYQNGGATLQLDKLIVQ